MKVRIKKWGNSAALRIPASVMAAADLSLEQTVDITEDGGRVIVMPIGPAYDLDQLVSQMDPETFPEDIDFGLPVGREAW